VIRSTFTDERQYDAVGNLVEGADVRDPLSPGRPGVGRLFYDANRNVSSVELLGSDTLEVPGDVLHRLEIERRSDGRVRRILRPYGGDAELVYDAFGDLVERRERVDGAWRSTRFERDPAGALVAIDLPNGMRRETERDAIGRVVETRLVRDGVVVQTATATWERGRLVERRDSIHGAPEQIVYDAAGRVERIRHPGGEITELEHDLRSRETRRTYRLAPSAPPLRTLERRFDGADREIELRDSGEMLLAREYAGGHPSRIRYGNGLVRDFEYDAELGVLLGTRTVSAETGVYVEDTRLGWSRCHVDALCVVAHTDIPGGPDGVPGLFTDESYRLGPLASGPSETGAAGLRLQAFVPGDLPSELGYEAPRYAFDALGNWLGVSEFEVPRTRFVFNDERNRLLAVEGATPHAYTWDEAGFATGRDGVALTWSPNGRPTAIGTRVAMEWDVLGRPVSTTVDGVTTRMRFGGEVVADASGTPLRLDLGEVVIDLAGSGHVYRHHDFRGNVQMVTDQSGVVVRHHTYSPFGVAESFGPYSDDRSFAGGTEIGGLLMLGARLYDPDAGRFLSPDPIFHALNQFAYTLGNPVFLWDPSGRHAESSPNSDGGLSNHVADLIDSIGLILIAAGLASLNFQYVGLGILLLAVSLKIRMRALTSAASCPACKVTVEEVHGDFGSGRPAYVEAADVNDLGCAPTAISATRTVPWASLALVGLQIGLASWLARWRRRRHTR
jgi:RHS repeat-associated protein